VDLWDRVFYIESLQKETGFLALDIFFQVPFGDVIRELFLSSFPSVLSYHLGTIDIPYEGTT